MARILVIDDDRFHRTFVEHALTQAGHNPISVEQSGDAERIQEEHHCDLVISDMFMPPPDGLELLRTFRKRWPNMPFIALSGGSADGRMDVLGMAKAMGAAAVLHKPFTAAELMETVQTVLPAPK